MTIFRSNCFFILFASLLLITTSCKKKNTSENKGNTAFEQFKIEFLDRLWELNPVWAVYEGNHKYDAELTVYDEAHRKKITEFVRSMSEKLNAFDPASLNDADKTDHALIDNHLKSTDWYLNVFKKYEWDPSNYNVGGPFDVVLTGRHASLNDRLKAIEKKLGKVPAFYEAAKKNIKSPTAEHTQLAIENNQGSLIIFEKALLDSTEKSDLPQATKNNIKNLSEKAAESIKSYIAFLENLQKELTPQKARSFRIGKELYDSKFRFDLNSGYSAEQMLQKALERKKYLLNEMYKISLKLWQEKYFKDKKPLEDSLGLIKAVITEIAKQHVRPEEFSEAIEKQIPALAKFVDDKKLLTQDPSKPLKVRPTPEYERGVAGASISAPGPYDKKADTYYNVTPLDGYTPEQAESYLREYNNYTLQILNIHEAIPGHYTQLVYSNKAPSIIKSVFGNGAMVEGWAVYSELMMLEAGYGNNNPELWLMYYKWNLRSVINFILDYSLHAGNMSEEDAFQMLTKEGFQEKAEAEGKIRRAKLTQVQLCSYFTGFQEICELKEELKDVLDNEFNLKKFHEDFLSYGSAPVRYIRELMLTKIEKSSTKKAEEE